MVGKVPWPLWPSHGRVGASPPRCSEVEHVGDWFPGQLILSRDLEDRAGAALLAGLRENEFEGLSLLESMERRLARLQLPRHETLGLETVLVAVPDGEEIPAISELMSRYLELSLGRASEGRASVLVTPNARLHLAAVCATELRPGDKEDCYLEMINADSGLVAGATEGTVVAVLDSGIDTCGEFNVGRAVNFIDDNDDVVDEWGHGTAVATLIRRLAPDAELYVAKVANDRGHVSEWDVLAALHLPTDVQVVNISLAFPLGTVNCPYCGRHSHVSRSRVFERILRRVCDREEQPLIVAAAGNDHQPQLAFPARFRDVISVSSIDSSGALSPFSNYGMAAHDGSPHPSRFVLPGGEHEDTEWVIEDPTIGKRWVGTSFSAGYASGIILNLIGGHRKHRSNDAMLDLLRREADQSVRGYSPATHGCGLMRLP
jgi:Subtilase family